MQLDDLKPGESATVLSVSLPEETRVRLCEMGLSEGRTVRLVRWAPLGDPLEIEVMDFHLAIRRAEARGVQVGRTP